MTKYPKPKSPSHCMQTAAFIFDDRITRMHETGKIDTETLSKLKQVYRSIYAKSKEIEDFEESTFTRWRDILVTYRALKKNPGRSRG